MDTGEKFLSYLSSNACEVFATNLFLRQHDFASCSLFRSHVYWKKVCYVLKLAVVILKSLDHRIVFNNV